eukprot:4046056-Pleurochrysis_carterae.AAC.1
MLDQTFATTKSIFSPRRGGGKGCASPFEMEAMIVDGLKKLNGGCEMLWQLANYDFVFWFDGCVAADFAHYGCDSTILKMYDDLSNASILICPSTNA